MNFILAMALYPAVLKKVQAEIDNVVGNGRLPTLQDRSSLPYVNACIKEAMRWRVVLPVSEYQSPSYSAQGNEKTDSRLTLRHRSSDQ